MLLPRWHQTLTHFRDQPAIFHGEAVLTFADLAAALATQPLASAPVLATGSALEIVLATLRGWRDGQPVVPVERKDGALPELDSLPSQVAHVKLTPGNDGRPRGVWFTAEQLAADADALVEGMGLARHLPNLATVSLTHSYGYSSIILPLLLHGIPLQTVEVPFPAVVAAAWKAHPQVVLPAVPSMWRAWHRSGILEQAPIALALSAGAPLALELEQSIWDRHQLKLRNFYGTSEAGGISFDTSSQPRSHAGDLGTPLPGVQVTLSDDDRFHITSPSVAIGYDHPRPGEKLGNGNFLTPDHGHLTSGRLILDARGGEHINVAGRKLGPGRIEGALQATGLTSHVRVFGLPSSDPERVEEVAALVPSHTDVAALRRAVSSALAGWEIPRHWFTSDQPSDFSLTRAALRARHHPETGSDPT
ncbi:acyl-coenzyme A synthetase/AMP-(fatty) acid ligase [Haloferula luteola]|uniref:Acyl-coenzyme A synthetase/AMP-(Fatty) acid ligase n=1 Tax=Haloferula luteola TaxID=595692 RepID=A0A840V736_9BACT|nr:AMP-binding protein [Haloferula luteola]MBB5351414.1 acyl-coenzyme A synthetase/AMP-(fatty) acid ligase [Haloferula luteola]